MIHKKIPPEMFPYFTYYSLHTESISRKIASIAEYLFILKQLLECIERYCEGKIEIEVAYNF